MIQMNHAPFGLYSRLYLPLFLSAIGVGASGRNSMARGLYLTSDGQVLVEYGKRRRVPIPSAQYKANGYKPPCEKLPPEVPRKARKELADVAPNGPWKGDF
jgi:hypothetical protein